MKFKYEQIDRTGGWLVFYNCLFTQDAGKIKAGERVSYVNVNLASGEVLLENVNEQMEEDEPLLLDTMEWKDLG